MTDIYLTTLAATNPGAVFAALGALDVATRLLPERRVTLRWSDSLVPKAVLHGPDSIDHLVELIDRDREGWADAVSLTGPPGRTADDIKPPPGEVRAWFEAAAGADLRLLHALISEGAMAGQPGDKERLAKPTHFHFTAGQQRFLTMVRELRSGLTTGDLEEALVGPWKYESTLPVLGWDAKGERLFALRAKDPSKEKKSGVPGVDWLGFLGLRFFPVTTTDTGGLVTTGCERSWKSGAFTWPVWDLPLVDVEVRTVIATDHSRLTAPERRIRGVSALYRSPIRRSDQGGYGSFAPAGPAV